MATVSDELVYDYRFASLIESDGIRLAAAANVPEKVADGTFFDGRLAYPARRPRCCSP